MTKQFYILQCPYCGHKMGTHATNRELEIWSKCNIKLQCSKCDDAFIMAEPNLYLGTTSEVLNQRLTP